MTIENIKIFFQPQYLFNPHPGYNMELMPYLLIFFVILVVLSVVSFIFLKKSKKLPIAYMWDSIYSWFLWVGIIGIILLFFRFEGIAYLSMRFLLLLWLIFFFLWGLYILWFGRKKYKEILKKFKNKKEKEKYFKKK